MVQSRGLRYCERSPFQSLSDEVPMRHAARFLSRSALTSSAACAVVVGTLLLAAPARADMDLPLESPIIKTMMSNDLDQFDRMLRTGTSPNSASTTGEPILVIAARNGMPEAVDIILKNGGRVDQMDSNGNTALMWAADQGHINIVQTLLKSGAQINRQNRQGITALMRAAQNNYGAVVDLLLTSGSDVTLTDHTGRGALSWAKESRSVAVAHRLEAAGATE